MPTSLKGVTPINRYTKSQFVTAFVDEQSMVEELGVPSAIIYGTALGVYRDGDFIPHDDDIDIMIQSRDLANLSHTSIREQQSYMNNIAKRHHLIPKNSRSSPYLCIRKKDGNAHFV